MMGAKDRYHMGSATYADALAFGGLCKQSWQHCVITTQSANYASKDLHGNKKRINDLLGYLIALGERNTSGCFQKLSRTGKHVWKAASIHRFSKSVHF